MNVLEDLAIKHPIFLSPMAGVSTPTLADKGKLKQLKQELKKQK